MEPIRLKGVWPERVGWMLLAVAVFWGLSSWWGWQRLDKRHPIALDEPIVATAADPVIMQGEDLTVNVRRTKVRDDCTTTSIRSAVRASDGETFSLGSEVWEGASAETEAVSFAYPTRHLPVGDYTLGVALHFQCPGDLTFKAQQPPVEFTIQPTGYIEPAVEQRTIIDQLKGDVENLQRQLNELPVPEMTR